LASPAGISAHSTVPPGFGAVGLVPSSASPQRAEPFALPCRLGDWELEKFGGQGSLACVYRGRGIMPTKPAADLVAVKVLRRRWEQRPQAASLLAREVEVAREVKSPHLISILDAQLKEAPYYVVMPWLEGETLEWLLARGRRPSVPVALWIARQVAEALGALDARGWMHGDVKPGNLFVSPRGHATLVDLGFCRRTKDVADVKRRELVGTVNYIAPEALTSSLAPDIRSDLYSLGVTLYEMLAGRLPFVGDNLADLALKHRQAAPPDLRSLMPSLDRRVVHLVHRLLAKDPLRRPQNPAELIRLLAALEIETFEERHDLGAKP
jgi:eukaryotic-like serine/threonine-protein kinase